ncbi:MAG: carbamoyltransferase [Actinobacteria bacterium]|nr:carbamoyltransferase [Actinomycetota bacterium]
MIVLGLNAFHGDASAAILVDGVVVAAAEEERFSRLKHQAGFPALAAHWCMDQAGVRPADLDHVAASRDPLANRGPRARWMLRHPPSPRSLRQRGASARRVVGLKRAFSNALEIDPAQLRATFHRVEHHRAHLASAWFCSPYEDAACLSIDGMGDFVSAMWGRGSGNRLDVDGSIPFPASLGIYYTAFTQFLGLPNYGDEYKLMGLAAYGEPRFLEAMRDVLSDDAIGYSLNLDYFVHHRAGVDMTWAAGPPTLGPLFSEKMAARFGPARGEGTDVTDRDQDLAASVQARLEEVELAMIRSLHARIPVPRLVLAGGVALNVLVNARVRSDTPFEDVWVQPAANDAGTAIGAALWVWNQVLGRPRLWRMDDAYLGPALDDGAADEALARAGLHAERVKGPELFERVAGRIAAGAIVGWAQGRMEFGPRALGNRSILCDPRRHDMKDILNARIKHRETFRPFAPSILADQVGEWFSDDNPSPFMLMAYPVRPERQHQIPAVTHADGTGRVQTVTRKQNARYYDLIAAFGRQTGVPVLLNTSFNENEPIVVTAAEAVDCFMRTRMDVLVLGDRVVDRGTVS